MASSFRERQGRVGGGLQWPWLKSMRRSPEGVKTGGPAGQDPPQKAPNTEFGARQPEIGWGCHHRWARESVFSIQMEIEVQNPNNENAQVPRLGCRQEMPVPALVSAWHACSPLIATAALVLRSHPASVTPTSAHGDGHSGFYYHRCCFHNEFSGALTLCVCDIMKDAICSLSLAPSTEFLNALRFSRQCQGVAAPQVTRPC